MSHSNSFDLPAEFDIPEQAVTRHLSLLAEYRPAAPRQRRFSNARPQTRRLAAVIATAALLGAIAAPAFGLHDTILDLFRSDVRFADAPPASSVTKRDFADMASGAPKGMNPNVVAGQTRLAATFDFGGSTRRVWVAPTSSGGFCYVIEGISGGCHASGAAREGVELDGGFVLRPGAQEPAMEAIAGKVFDPRATMLRVTFEDRKTIALPFVFVSEPINAGFFAYKPTGAQQQPGHRPAAIVLLDAEGRTIARREIDWEHEARKAKQLKNVFDDASRSPAETAEPKRRP